MGDAQDETDRKAAREVAGLSEADAPATDPDAAAGAWTLETLYRRYFDEVRRYVAGRFGAGPPAPEDVAQQAFVRLAGSDGYETIRNPRAFLFQSARNAVIDEHRRAATRRGYADGAGAVLAEQSDDRHPERVLSARERLAIVRETVEAMAPQQRRSFLLHRVEGLSFVEIAQRTGYSQSGVKKHVAQALEALDEAVAAAEGDQRRDDT